MLPTGLITPSLGMMIAIGKGLRGPVEVPVPQRIAGLVLWLRSDMGITAVNAAVASPNDISTASWAKTNCTTPDAQTILESNDGAPAVHFVNQAIVGMQVNHVATLNVEVHAGATGRWFYCELGNGTTARAYLDPSTGTLGTVSGTASVVALPNGWYRLTLSGVVTTSNGCLLYTASGNNSVSYQGNGTGSILVRNISITQQNVSAWADQSGNGNHLTQGTAAAQPLWNASDSNFAGQSSVQLDGVDDYLISGTFDISAGSGWTHVITFLDTQTALSAFIDKSVTATVTGIYENLNPTAVDRTELYMKGSTSATKGLRPTADTNSFSTPTVWGAVFDPSLADTSEIVAFKNNTALAMTSVTAGETTGNLGNTALALGATSTGTAPTACRIVEMVAYNRPLSTLEMTAVSRYMGARYGITVA